MGYEVTPYRPTEPVRPRPTPEMETNTHGMVVSGASGTAAGDTVIGTMTLPAGGPWKIWGVWCQGVLATATAGESLGGHFRVNSVSGDVTPNPAPSRFPAPLLGSFLGTTQQAAMCKLRIYPVAWEAPGKAVIQLLWNNPTTITVAAQIVMGILFGKTTPELRPILYIDRVRAAVTAAVDTLVGTITLAEKATRITAVSCVMAQDKVMVAGEELTGFFRLGSDDVKLPPMQLPISAVYSAGLGAAIEQAQAVDPVMIPVDIPVPGGGRIDCFIDLNTAVTNAAEVGIFLAYE